VGFNGMGMELGSLSRLAGAETRSVTAENVYGAKGRGGMADLSAAPQPEVVRIGQKWVGPYPAARDLGRGWKVRPKLSLEPQSVTTIMDVNGPGVIQHIWITIKTEFYRDLILRIYWDGEQEPSVEAPVGDFFCSGFRTPVDVRALPINVNPYGGLNSFFPMPFRRHARITIENRKPAECQHFFYAINYVLIEVPADEAYFHAQFRRTNPLPYRRDYTILDGVKGRGHYVGTYMAWQQNNNGWWGEGEFKVFLDGDREFPTICGTGTEDYFGGAWGFGTAPFTAPFFGYYDLTALAVPGSVMARTVGHRHGMYRFHIMDPIRFRSDFRCTMQALGWRSEGRYLPLQDDIASVAYWYQAEPHAKFPPLGDRDALEVV
jgi:hypothetical protein